MRDIIIAGNWKMNKDIMLTLDFCVSLTVSLEDKNLRGIRVIIAPPHPFLASAMNVTEKSVLRVAAQDVSAHHNGAYTGETSAEMLDSLHVQYSIVGHSERRQYHKEDGALIREKLKRLMEVHLIPILCIGETLDEREAGKAEEVIRTQLEEAFKDLNILDGRDIIIAYEPVWAIGTGKTATAEQAQAAHAFIRNWLKQRFGSNIAANMHLLYGGSMKPDNIAELIAQPDIDGGLIGGASLNREDFLAMITAAQNQRDTRS